MPVDVIEGGILGRALHYEDYWSVVQYSDLLLNRVMEESGWLLPVHRSIAHTVRGMRISQLVVID